MEHSDQKKRYFLHFVSDLPIIRIICRLVWSVNGRGSLNSFISVSASSRLPLRRLHGWQQATRFSHVDKPPRERGITWSSVRSAEDSSTPQYWHVLRSRRRMFLRDKARVWCGMRRYSSSLITDGTRMASRAACRK